MFEVLTQTRSSLRIIERRLLVLRRVSVVLIIYCVPKSVSFLPGDGAQFPTTAFIPSEAYTLYSIGELLQAMVNTAA